MPFSLFIRNSKILMRLNAFFEGLQSENIPIMLLFFIKHLYLLTAEITPDANKSFFTWREGATVGDSLHV